MHLPVGTMTFLVMEPGLSLAQDRLPGARPDVLSRFQAAADAALAAHQGHRCVSRTGDGVSAVLGSVVEAPAGEACCRPTAGGRTGHKRLCVRRLAAAGSARGEGGGAFLAEFGWWRVGLAG
jgi:class 3 adenylate cyclase